MFDIGWSELMILAVLAIVVVGPRDLPRMMRTVGEYVSKLRRMSREFQSQFNEAVREADLEDVRKTMTDIKSGNPISEIRDAVTQPLKSVADDLKSSANEIENAASMTSKPTSAPTASADAGTAPTPASAEASAQSGTTEPKANGDAAPETAEQGEPAPVAVAAKPEPEPAPVKTAAGS